ncbi:hypothetical protein L2173_16930 [Citrobacter portucalensis]|nr:hypothetical protein [Citrobacter portucalensis]
MCDGENLYCTSTRAAYPRSASYVRSTLYDVWWKHSCPPENPRPPRYKNDHALCSSGPRPP